MEQTEKKTSKLQDMKNLLSGEEGYTKQELSELTGLKLSTVNCQIYHHLPNKGYPTKRLEGGKYRFLNDIEMDEYVFGLNE